MANSNGTSARVSGTTILGSTSFRVIDGNTNGWPGNNTCLSTPEMAQPWMALDLGANRTVAGLTLWSRVDCCKGKLLYVYVLTNR